MRYAFWGLFGVLTVVLLFASRVEELVVVCGCVGGWWDAILNVTWAFFCLVLEIPPCYGRVDSLVD